MAITEASPIETVLGDIQKSKRDKIVKGLGLRTVGDLLRHFPRRYLNTSELTEVSEPTEGEMLTVVGEVLTNAEKAYTDRRSGRKAFRNEILVKTDGPSLQLSFFAKRKGIQEWNSNRMPVGRTGVFTGKVGSFRGQWQLTNPQVAMFGDQSSSDDATAATLDALKGLYPIYPLTNGVDSWDVSRAVNFALSVVEGVTTTVPGDVRRDLDLVDAARALELVHSPDNYAQVETGRAYFRFEEALVTQTVLAKRRAEVRTLAAVARPGTTDGLLAEFDRRLPFDLTEGQVEVGEQIAADLAQPHPMHRLLQGEVGSGKTLVALRAMLHTIDAGGQAALLAPTEVLAQQHHRSITQLMGDLAAGGMLGGSDLGTQVVLLTGSMNKQQRQVAMLGAASGEAGIVVGTHALLEDNVQFADLGLIVVDEQHRFGVEQRSALSDKAGAPPHVLVMTATPIPRTVAMTVFGDLEISTLKQLPAGRAAIQSNVVPLADQPDWFGRVWERVVEEVDDGHQAYIVCPRIAADDDASQLPITPDSEVELGELAAVEELAPQLAQGPLSGVRVEALHGRLAPDDKDRIMREFAVGEIDAVVATTVIEVGVDVANATMMVILDADRFGVSQLHQLRGRVGRGGLPGLCLLVTRAEAGSPARERLAAVAATTDGFALSEVDLEQRREGDVLGASQSGFRSSLVNLRVLRDEKTITAARVAAEDLLARDPDLDTAADLRVAVEELEASVQSQYLDKS